MALKTYRWRFRAKVTVSRFDRASFVSKIPTIVKRDLEQNATKQGKYLRVMEDPKVKIISVKPHAPILGLYGHEDVVFEVTTKIRAVTSPAIIITTVMIYAILAIIAMTVGAVASHVILSDVKEIMETPASEAIAKGIGGLGEAVKATTTEMGGIPILTIAIAVIIVAVVAYMLLR